MGGLLPGRARAVFWYGVQSRSYGGLKLFGTGIKPKTNNIVEGFALLATLEWLATVDVDCSMHVLVLDDS